MRRWHDLHRAVLMVVCVTGLVASIHAQEIERLEFVRAPIADMLVAIGRATGRSVIPDRTVTGTGSYYFDAVDFDEALATLADRFGLFVTHHDGIYSVSALRISATPSDNGMIIMNVEAPRARVDVLLERISREAGIPILFERLPPIEVAFFARDESLEQVLGQLASRLPEHRLVANDGGFLFRFVAPDERIDRARPQSDWITGSEGRYSIKSGASSLPELLALIFDHGGREYQLLARGARQVSALSFSGVPFDTLVRLVLEQADASFSVSDGVYYIVDAPPAAAAARAMETAIVSLDHLDTTTVLGLLAPESAAGVTIREGRSVGTISLTGTPSHVQRVAQLIRTIDAEPEGARYRRFDLDTVDAATLGTVLPRPLASLPSIAGPDGASVFIETTDAQADRIVTILDLVDRPRTSSLVRLDHIDTATLIAHLPPSARTDQIVPTADPRAFFFVGPESQRVRFMADLNEVDRAPREIRYQLLVLQVQRGRSLDFSVDLSNALAMPDSSQAFLASVGRMLSLDFDIVSAFGYQFTARLEAGLADAQATIVADTSLSALSGESVTFRNTNTYRYRDTSAAEDGAATTGVVREITSGLILELRGDVVADGVIVEIAATVSRRGVDATGNPPPTSEKVLRTQVLARSGTPVALTGLRQTEEERSSRGIPFVSEIPVLGWLFSDHRKTVDATELAIYVVPWVVEPEPGTADDADLMDLFNRFGANR